MDPAAGCFIDRLGTEPVATGGQPPGRQQTVPHGRPQLMTATARPERQILRVADLQAQLGLSRTTIWRLRRAGEIPQPVRISPNAVGWPVHVITEWLAQRPEA